MPIQINDIWAIHSDGTRANKFNRRESFQIRYSMFVPKAIADNKTKVNYDVALVRWGDNTTIYHICGFNTYPPEAGDHWVNHWFGINPNPLGNAPYTSGGSSYTGGEWMKFQAAVDVEGKDEIAHSPERFIKFQPFILY